MVSLLENYFSEFLLKPDFKVKQNQKHQTETAAVYGERKQREAEKLKMLSQYFICLNDLSQSF